MELGWKARPITHSSGGGSDHRALELPAAGSMRSVSNDDGLAAKM